ncbi:hypothetical protein V5O48_014744 [Marasmius crinis-equi]|uniref:Uncharacterized protein n=1 Tax=Marasmius crinis-equi TaxID=585013 RepID=A0ABR3EWF4_9AGAR
MSSSGPSPIFQEPGVVPSRKEHAKFEDYCKQITAAASLRFPDFLSNPSFKPLVEYCEGHDIELSNKIEEVFESLRSRWIKGKGPGQRPPKTVAEVMELAREEMADEYGLADVEETKDSGEGMVEGDLPGPNDTGGELPRFSELVSGGELPRELPQVEISSTEVGITSPGAPSGQLGVYLPAVPSDDPLEAKRVSSEEREQQELEELAETFHPAGEPKTPRRSPTPESSTSSGPGLLVAHLEEMNFAIIPLPTDRPANWSPWIDTHDRVHYAWDEDYKMSLADAKELFSYCSAAFRQNAKLAWKEVDLDRYFANAPPFPNLARLDIPPSFPAPSSHGKARAKSTRAIKPAPTVIGLTVDAGPSTSQAGGPARARRMAAKHTETSPSIGMGMAVVNLSAKAMGKRKAAPQTPGPDAKRIRRRSPVVVGEGDSRVEVLEQASQRLAQSLAEDVPQELDFHIGQGSTPVRAPVEGVQPRASSSRMVKAAPQEQPMNAPQDNPESSLELVEDSVPRAFYEQLLAENKRLQHKLSKAHSDREFMTRTANRALSASEIFVEMAEKAKNLDGLVREIGEEVTKRQWQDEEPWEGIRPILAEVKELRREKLSLQSQLEYKEKELQNALNNGAEEMELEVNSLREEVARLQGHGSNASMMLDDAVERGSRLAVTSGHDNLPILNSIIKDVVHSFNKLNEATNQVPEPHRNRLSSALKPFKDRIVRLRGMVDSLCTALETNCDMRLLDSARAFFLALGPDSASKDPLEIEARSQNESAWRMNLHFQLRGFPTDFLFFLGYPDEQGQVRSPTFDNDLTRARISQEIQVLQSQSFFGGREIWLPNMSLDEQRAVLVKGAAGVPGPSS